MLQDLPDDPRRQSGRAGEIKRFRLGVFQRHGDAGAAEEGSLDGRRHRAGVQDVYPGVGSGIETADDQVGRFLEQFQKGQLDAIGRPALHRPAQRLLGLVFHLLHQQRGQQRDGMSHGTLLSCRGDHRHFSQLFELQAQGPQAGGIDAVVIG